MGDKLGRRSDEIRLIRFATGSLACFSTYWGYILLTLTHAYFITQAANDRTPENNSNRSQQFYNIYMLHQTRRDTGNDEVMHWKCYRK